MRLRKPCIHNRYDPHVTGYASPTCPGGEFLPEDALVIEKVHGEWPVSIHSAASKVEVPTFDDQGEFDALFGVLVSSDVLNRVLDALANDQVGESE